MYFLKQERKAGELSEVGTEYNPEYAHRNESTEHDPHVLRTTGLRYIWQFSAILSFTLATQQRFPPNHNTATTLCLPEGIWKCLGVLSVVEKLWGMRDNLVHYWHLVMLNTMSKVVPLPSMSVAPLRRNKMSEFGFFSRFLLLAYHYRIISN